MKRVDELKMKSKKSRWDNCAIASTAVGVASLLGGIFIKNKTVRTICSIVLPTSLVVDWYFIGRGDGIDDVYSCVVPTLEEEKTEVVE